MKLDELNTKLAEIDLVLHPTKGFRKLSSSAPRMTRETMAIRDTLLPKRPAGENIEEFIVHVRPENSRHRAITWRTPLLSAPFEPRGKSYKGASAIQESARRLNRMKEMN
ncbi:MAG TPA: hypothetical protein VIU82_00350 [Bosea sp. (in: a-proteobacteria)]